MGKERATGRKHYEGQGQRSYSKGKRTGRSEMRRRAESWDKMQLHPVCYLEL